eukprot:scaffold17633_cov65-Phaeocystis_antarctica.AAC.5
MTTRRESAVCLRASTGSGRRCCARGRGADGRAALALSQPCGETGIIDPDGFAYRAGGGGEDMPAVLRGRRRPTRTAVCLPRLRHMDPRTLPRALAAHEPKGGRSLPLRPVHGPLPRRAEPRAAECTAPDQAHEWPEHNLYRGQARAGAAGPGQALGNRHPSTFAFINNLSTLLLEKGDLAAAEPLCREALEVGRETLGNRHPSTLAAINNLGQLLKDKGDLAAAEPLCREALEVQRETLGNRHPHTLNSVGNLGSLLQDKGDLTAAESLYREALKVQRETLGNRHPETLASINNLGTLLYIKGDLAAAEPLLRESLEVLRETLGSKHPNTLSSIENFSKLSKAKAKAAAEPMQREEPEVSRDTLGGRHLDTFDFISSLRRLLKAKLPLQCTLL